MSVGFGGRQCALATLVMVLGLPIAAAGEANAAQSIDEPQSQDASWSVRAALNTAAVVSEI